MSSDENGLGPSSPSDPEGIEGPDSEEGSGLARRPRADRRGQPVDAGRAPDGDRTTDDTGSPMDGARVPQLRAADAPRAADGAARRGRTTIPDERLETVLARICGGFYDDPETATQVAIRILALERYRLFED
jgi:hypothetical protein